MYRLCSTDVLLDVGCSGGTALIILTCLTNCTGIGIDIDDNRIALANLHSKSIMEKKTFIRDVNIAFEQRDISKFKNFNGFTVLYMYDCAFDKSYLGPVSSAINSSNALRCFITSTKLECFRSNGLSDKWTITDNIQITQVGGMCNRTLYIYTKNIATTDNDYCFIDVFVNNLINRATNELLRKEYVDEAFDTWLKSEDFIRQAKIPDDRQYCNKQATKLYDLLQNKTYFRNDCLSRFYCEESLTEYAGTKCKYR